MDFLLLLLTSLYFCALLSFCFICSLLKRISASEFTNLPNNLIASKQRLLILDWNRIEMGLWVWFNTVGADKAMSIELSVCKFVKGIVTIKAGHFTVHQKRLILVCKSSARLEICIAVSIFSFTHFMKFTRHPVKEMWKKNHKQKTAKLRFVYLKFWVKHLRSSINQKW